MIHFTPHYVVWNFLFVFPYFSGSKTINWNGNPVSVKYNVNGLTADFLLRLKLADYLGTCFS